MLQEKKENKVRFICKTTLVDVETGEELREGQLNCYYKVDTEIKYNKESDIYIKKIIIIKYKHNGQQEIEF